jgi:hypothetical protein
MLTCPPSHSLWRPVWWGNENMKNLSHSQFTNFQVSTRHDSWCLLDYWLAQVPLTYTHVCEMFFQCSSFLLSMEKSRHLNIIYMFYASKRTAALTEHHYIFSYFYSKWCSRDAKIISPEIVFECIMLKNMYICYFFYFSSFLFFIAHFSWWLHIYMYSIYISRMEERSHEMWTT